MRAIRRVAATQRAVICTIHQPSTYLFEMFDALLLLKKGGQTVFFGPTGEHSSSLISYLQVASARCLLRMLVVKLHTIFSMLDFRYNSTCRNGCGVMIVATLVADSLSRKPTDLE